MNLIEQETSPSSIVNFRTYQYSLIKELIHISMEYLINLGLIVDKKVYRLYDDNCIIVKEKDSYKGIGYYAQLDISLRIEDNKKYFLYLTIPDLVHNTFFILNGSKYVPIMYIADEPIVLKEDSIILSSLFHSLTIYYRDNRAVFMGNNINLQDFLKLITVNWNQDLRDQVYNEFAVKTKKTNKIEEIVRYMSEQLNCSKTIPDIKNQMTKLFFNKWTFQLYQQFYGIENPDIDLILQLALTRKINKEQPSFIDLEYKRLTFIEPLFRPFFNAVGKAAKLLLMGHSPKKLDIDINKIGKHFFDQNEGLNSNVLYDTVNGFSSILAHRASFKNPFGSGRLPTEVSSIHTSHKGRICVISISNKDPGVTVSLSPDQGIDPRFGIFTFHCEVL